MPYDEDLIRRIADAANGSYSKQEELIEKFLQELDELRKNNASQESINQLSDTLAKLQLSINAQNEVISELISKAESFGIDKNDVETLGDMVRYLEELVRLTRRIEEKQNELDEARRNSPSDSELIDRIENEINDAINERLSVSDEMSAKYSGQPLNNMIFNTIGFDTDTENKIFDAYQKRERANESAQKHLQISRAIGDSYGHNAERLKEIRQNWMLITDAARASWKVFSDGASYWLKYNEQAINDAKKLGIITKEGAMGYMETMMANTKQLSRDFGMPYEQAMKLTSAYTSATGRAAMLSKEQMQDVAASSKIMGQETVMSAIKIMDSMGSTSQTATELLDRNFARAVNSGLDTVKASEEFVKNMSLANRLSFRNGVDGISKMTIMSQTIKLNLQEVANVAEKFSTIEGAIEGSARLQMLGGPVAMLGGNPMEMLYESISDPEALAERIKKMAGTQAFFNRKTGVAEIDPVTLGIMREQEKVLGMSPGTLIGSAKQRSKIGEIEKDFRRYNPDAFANATKDQITAVTNKAEFDVEKGTWTIKYVDENSKEQVAELKDLNTETLEKITKDNLEPVQDIRYNVRQIANQLVSTKERKDSLYDQFRTGVAQGIHGLMKKFDGFLNWINKSPFWSFITRGTALTAAISIAGAGMLKFITKGIGIFTNTVLTRFAQRFMVGGASRFIGNFANKVSNFFGLTQRTTAASAGGKPTFAELRQRRLNGEEGRLTRRRNAARGASSNSGSNSLLNKIKNSFTRSGSSAGRFAKIGRNVGRIGKLGGPALLIAGTAYDTYSQLSQANDKYQRQMDFVRSANESKGYSIGGRRRRYSEMELSRMKTYAENRRSEERAGAIGSGVGAVSGAMIGATIGSAIPVLGTVVGGIIGSAIGGYAGSKLGKKVGRDFASTKDDDIINAHLNEINKADEEENFRKIVLPVESIDYNVSLIANQLGILTAMPARGNVYLQAEAAGEVVAESRPLEASSVNQVDSQIINASSLYKPVDSFKLDINVNGSIGLNMRGINMGKLSDADVKEIIDRPEIRRYLTERILHTAFGNANAGHDSNEGLSKRANASDVGGIRESMAWNVRG